MDTECCSCHKPMTVANPECKYPGNHPQGHEAPSAPGMGEEERPLDSAEFRALCEATGPDDDSKTISISTMQARKLIAALARADALERENNDCNLRWAGCSQQLKDAISDLESTEAKLAAALARAEDAERLLNTPETADFLEGVKREAAHQVKRWGYAHDRSKSAENWFWLVGYLAGKALRSTILGDRDKALHHTVSSAAALFNWHTAIANDSTGTCEGQDDDLRAANPIDAAAEDAALASAPKEGR
jgi:hypothetical protein